MTNADVVQLQLTITRDAFPPLHAALLVVSSAKGRRDRILGLAQMGLAVELAAQAGTAQRNPLIAGAAAPANGTENAQYRRVLNDASYDEVLETLGLSS